MRFELDFYINDSFAHTSIKKYEYTFICKNTIILSQVPMVSLNNNPHADDWRSTLVQGHGELSLTHI